MISTSQSMSEMRACTPAAGSAATVLGIDIGGTNLRLALGSDAGAILARTSISLGEDKSPSHIIALIEQCVARLYADSGQTQHGLKAIAVGAPGVTDTENGIVIATSYLLGWRNVPLRALLTERFQVPVVIDNDVNLAALGEYAFGQIENLRDFAFIAIGTGIGSGLILNGGLHRGQLWTAGEIGYMLVPGTDIAPVERGIPGALEQIVGGEGLRQTWKRRWSAADTKHPQDLNASGIFEAARTGDLIATSITESAAQTLAFAIYNMAIVLNLPHFIMGGGVGSHPVLLEATQKYLNAQNARVQPRLIASTLGTDAQLLGALRAALIHTHA